MHDRTHDRIMQAITRIQIGLSLLITALHDEGELTSGQYRALDPKQLTDDERQAAADDAIDFSPQRQKQPPDTSATEPITERTERPTR
jgi:hypothetical protein